VTDKEKAMRLIADAINSESRRAALVRAILTGAHASPALATIDGRSRLAVQAVELASLAEAAFIDAAEDGRDFSAEDLRSIVQSPRYVSCRSVVDPNEAGVEQQLLEFAISDNRGRVLTFCGPPHFIVRSVITEIMQLDAQAASREGI